MMQRSGIMAERYPRPIRQRGGLRALRGLQSAERPGHSATTAHCQAAYPFIAEGGLGGRGVYIGRDAFGGSFAFDPWELYDAGTLSGPNVLVIGQIGRGKSACVKSYLYRQRVFGREAWAIDPKSEYAPLAQALGGTVIALRPGGSVRLNPLSSRGGREAQLSLLRSVTQAALRRELAPEEDAGLRVSLELVNRRVDGGEPVLPEIVEALLHPRPEMAEELATTSEALASATRQTALAMQRLCAGDLRGMFDGPTTGGLSLDAPLVVLDLSAMQDSAALGILMTCAAAWQQALMMERRREAERGGAHGAKVICVLDEGWRVASHIGVAEWLQQSFKLSRALGVQNVMVMHRLSDLGSAGAAGSREARIAEGLVADADTKIVYAQPPDQLEGLRNLLGLTSTELEIVPTLRRGEALWQVGRRSFLVQHTLAEAELPIVDTDARMKVEQPDERPR
jgi:type IV secretory pathway VirB4 component